jgi:DNA-binding GntR family transcriptional regulator
MHEIPFEHKQLWQSIGDQLRDEILDGRLPAGSRLRETDLAERFGVSRGPIRDALRELARTGLVEDLPRRGTFVCRLTEEDLTEVYVLRRAIEEAAVRLAIARATDADLDGMFEILAAAEAAYEEDDLPAAWEADMAFHRTYCDLSGNRRLRSLTNRISDGPADADGRRAGRHWDGRRRSSSPADRDRHRGPRRLAIEAVGAHYQYTHDRLAASGPVLLPEPGRH